MNENKSSSERTPERNQGKQAPFGATVGQAPTNPPGGWMVAAVNKIGDQLLLYIIVISGIIGAICAGAAGASGAAPGLIVVILVGISCVMVLGSFGLFRTLRQEAQTRKVEVQQRRKVEEQREQWRKVEEQREQRRKVEEQRRERLSPATSPPSSKEEYKTVIESPSALQFWKPFVQGKLRVVTGRFTRTSKKLEVWEPAGLLGVGDAMAIADLRTFFGVMGLSDFEVSYASSETTVDLDTNLILLGGPDYNNITALAMKKIKSTFRFADTEQPYHQIAITDEKTDSKTKGKLWDYKEKASGELTDYSLIIRRANPFYPDKQLLLVAGCSGYGTWAGIRFVTSVEFLELPLVSRGEPGEFLIKTKVMFEKPLKPKLVDEPRPLK
jgi:hypothetical protein